MIKLLYIDDTTIGIELFADNDIYIGLSPREREKVATSRIVKAIAGEEATIDHLSSGAPLLVNDERFISISHCKIGVAVAINPSYTIGIDFETMRYQLDRVKEKYLSAREQQMYGSLPLMLQAWTAKEALYKAALIPGLPLIEGIHLDNPNASRALVVAPDGGTPLPFSLHFHHIDSTALLALATPLGSK